MFPPTKRISFANPASDPQPKLSAVNREQYSMIKRSYIQKLQIKKQVSSPSKSKTINASAQLRPPARNRSFDRARSKHRTRQRSSSAGQRKARNTLHPVASAPQLRSAGSPLFLDDFDMVVPKTQPIRIPRTGSGMKLNYRLIPRYVPIDIANKLIPKKSDTTQESDRSSISSPISIPIARRKRCPSQESISPLSRKGSNQDFNRDNEEDEEAGHYGLFLADLDM